jgi:pimeloyl-ACP methyl ester carboxylesterase
MTRDPLRRPEQSHPPLGAVVSVPVDAGCAGGESVAVHYVDEGPRDAPALVLIHGASGNLRDFAFGLVGQLARRYRVAAFDRPGFGYSERPARDGWRPDVQARILRRAARAIGIERPMVIGHSLGGAAALAWALAAPDEVAGVMTLAGVSHAWPGGISVRYDIAAAPVIGKLVASAVMRFADRGFIEREIAGIFEPQNPPAGYVDFIGVGLALRPGTFQANGRDVSRLKPFLAEQQRGYPGLPMPVFALHGDADTIVPLAVHARPLSERTPRGRLLTIRQAGHMPHHTHQAAVIDAIDALAAAGAAA